MTHPLLNTRTNAGTPGIATPDALEHRAATLEDAARAILDGAQHETRQLAQTERDDFDALTAAADAARTRAADLRDHAARVEEVRAATPAGVRARVGTEARTYTSHTERAEGRSFIADVIARGAGDFDAGQRLARHMAEERHHRGPGIEARAAGTGAFAGLVVPQYLTDLAAPFARPMRPFADIANRHPLPDAGMSVNISRLTTGTSVAVQATQNTAVSETDADDTLLTIPVVTIAGQQTISRQAIERGTGVDELVVADLVRAYASTLDFQCLNGTGLSGQHQGIDSLSGVITSTFTSASPTVALLWPRFFDLVQQIQSGAYAGVTHLVMHPRRFWWLAANVGTNFPFVQMAGSSPQTAGSVAGTQYGEGISGTIAGIPVIVDGNVTTTAGGSQDVIYAVTAPELHLWEDANAPLFIRAETTNASTLGITLVAYGYSAFTAGRYPNAHGRIAGSGLATPAFA